MLNDPFSTLRDIADQILRSLESDLHVAHQAVSLELLIRGFSTFQNYLDAVQVLRSVFRLATAVNISNVLRNLARQTILSVASVNAPLFMTVLSFDAMQADADPEERAATMKLIAFMVRKVSATTSWTLPYRAFMLIP